MVEYPLNRIVVKETLMQKNPWEPIYVPKWKSLVRHLISSCVDIFVSVKKGVSPAYSEMHFNTVEGKKE